MEEVKDKSVEETTSEKKYEFRRLGADDIFIMVNIISKIGVNKFTSCFKNEGVQDLVKSLKGNKKVKSTDISLIVGGSVFLEVTQVILENLPKCKNDIYQLLSNTSNLSIDEIKEDGITFLDMLTDFIKKEEFMDFFKRASRFVSKEN